MQSPTARQAHESAFPSSPDQLPGTAHIEDYRPGAVMQAYHNGRVITPPMVVKSYPYSLGSESGAESVFVDVTLKYPKSDLTGEAFDSDTFESLVDAGVVPDENGLYNTYNNNAHRLVKPAPVKDPAVPRSLRKILERPYDRLTTRQKEKATRYFLGQQATAYLGRQNHEAGLDRLDEKLLHHSSVKVY